jgi:hypothetical protein
VFEQFSEDFIKNSDAFCAWLMDGLSSSLSHVHRLCCSALAEAIVHSGCAKPTDQRKNKGEGYDLDQDYH